ncbi:MAG: hypothetical protein ACRDD7_02720 [Peptostreptococcaceae bacterium]
MCFDKRDYKENTVSKYSESKLCKEYKEVECFECQLLCKDSPWFIRENNKKTIESKLNNTKI